MSEKTLKFNNIILNKKKFHRSKNQMTYCQYTQIKQLYLCSFKYFIGYLKGEIIKPLCIILPQMSGYKKYFENGSKNMSFSIKDDEIIRKFIQKSVNIEKRKRICLNP